MKYPPCWEYLNDNLYITMPFTNTRIVPIIVAIVKKDPPSCRPIVPNVIIEVKGACPPKDSEKASKTESFLLLTHCV